MQPLPVLEWKWEVISMDFITGFPMTWIQHDSIMVVVDKLTKEAHFIPFKSKHKTDDIAKIFMSEILKLHGFPKAIVSDIDVKFTSKFWKGLFADLGTKLKFSTVYQPQTNGQTKRVAKCLKTCFTCM